MALALEFTECASCAAKPGALVLCSGCLANRAAFNVLKEHLKIAHAERDEWIRHHDAFAKGARELARSLRAEVAGLRGALREAINLGRDERWTSRPREMRDGQLATFDKLEELIR